MVSIRGYSPYVPLYRIERSSIAEQFGDRAGEAETAVPAHDETVLSLATAAAKDAIEHATTDDLGTVFVASSSDPFDERGLAPHVASAVGALGDVAVGDFQGSARAATNALVAARDACVAGRGPALVVAADIMAGAPGTQAEQTAGAGAGAFVLGEDGAVAEISETVPNTTGFLGRFRHAGETPTEGHGRFNRVGYLEAVGEALDGLQAAPDHVAVPEPDGGWGGRALDRASIEAERHSTFDGVGWAGAASGLLDLSLALDRAAPGETVALAGYGPGGSDVIVFETGEGVTEAPELTVTEYIESKSYVSYATHRSNRERARGES
jgi:hydroxymethylglutaryl-CoA synthase